MTSEAHAIIAFGDLEGPQGKIPADDVIHGLFAKSVWYTTRKSNIITPGTKLLFYKSGRGFYGSAIVNEVIPDSTQHILGRQTFANFAYRLKLDDCHVFKATVEIREIVQDLDFIKDKTHWGQALRSTPRRISASDFRLISRRATST